MAIAFIQSLQRRCHASHIIVLLSCWVAIGCGTNPVTKKTEFQFVSEQQEIAIGQENYAPARQSQGGDYTIDSTLTAYVQSIGKRLAAVSDRPELPYEFVVLNSSIPNAWAMPGGKIAFNRGLLYELHNEAELAAVMGHEIVHAAARHGAKSIERGVFLQGAMIAVGIGAQNSNYGNLIVGGAQLGAQLASSKYGRDAESEADLYGMQYMKKAGYDPTAAVTLQETFVRLSQDQRSDFISGLFASHPPSPERVAANKQTLALLGAGGELGAATYQQKVAATKASQPAYQAYDAGVAALGKGDFAQATQLAQKAISIEPREAHFQELLGDIALTEKKPQAAIAFYDKAIKLQPDYFKPYVQTGIALFSLGKKAEAEPFLKKANSLLPTAPSHALLGELAEARGDTNDALQHYQLAAGSDSDIGRQAKARAVRLDLPRNPASYIPAGVLADNAGNLFAVIQNDTGVDLLRIQLRVVQYDARTGRAIAQSRPLSISNVANGKRGQVAIGVRVPSPQAVQLYKTVVEAATPAN